MTIVLRSPIVIATHNPGKLREMAEILAPLGLEVISAGELGLPEPEETGTSFAENAALKARTAAKASGKLSLADDSGLEVPVLDGAPGIYSARWAGESKNFGAAMDRVQHEIEALDLDPVGAPARFVCALSLSEPDGTSFEFIGTVEGQLTFPGRGDKGFGYDPIFVPNGHATTFAEMEPADKHAMSHRADAFRQLISYFNQPKTGTAS